MQQAPTKAPEASKPVADDRMSSLRNERDRFVAFSFAAADLLLEVDADNVIQVAYGATRGLTSRHPDQLVKVALLELVSIEDRQLVAAALEMLQPGARLEPLAAHFADSRGVAVMGGCRLPDGDGHCFLTLSAARPSMPEFPATGRRDVETGLIAAQDFPEVAAERIESARRDGHNVELSLLRLIGLEDLAMRSGPDVVGALHREVGAFLRAHSLGGNTAGRLSSNGYSVVHDAGIRTESFERAIGDMARSKDVTGEGLQVEGATLDLASGNLSAEEATRALAFTISRVAEGIAEGIELGSLSDTLNTLLGETVQRTDALKATIRDSRFRLFFQPIVDLATGEVHHYEVLSRFENETTPFQVIKFAEEIGLICDFDLAVCRLAAETLRQREESAAPVTLAVNLSGRSVQNPDFLHDLRRSLVPLGHLRQRLAFEITESWQMIDLEAVSGVLASLRRDGHAICLDDFGAGAACFPYLQTLTVDFVKIDGAYVRKIQGSTRDVAILRALAGLCRELDIGTVAEMVETPEQCTMIREIGVQFGQGWLFGRASPEFQAAPTPRPRVQDRPRQGTRRAGASVLRTSTPAWKR